jgi:hypothetical protein
MWATHLINVEPRCYNVMMLEELISFLFFFLFSYTLYLQTVVLYPRLYLIFMILLFLFLLLARFFSCIFYVYLGTLCFLYTS